MRTRGIENYEIDDMDVTFISEVIHKCSLSVKKVNSTVTKYSIHCFSSGIYYKYSPIHIHIMQIKYAERASPYYYFPYNRCF